MHMKYAELLTAEQVSARPRGVPLGARERRHPRAPRAQPARSSRRTAARVDADGLVKFPPEVVASYMQAVPAELHLPRPRPAVRPHDPRRRPRGRHRQLGAQRGRPRDRRRAPRHLHRHRQHRPPHQRAQGLRHLLDLHARRRRASRPVQPEPLLPGAQELPQAGAQQHAQHGRPAHGPQAGRAHRRRQGRLLRAARSSTTTTARWSAR